MILAGATAVVTGGAVRIGRAIARHLAGKGVNVCLHYGHSRAEAKEAVEELQALGVKVVAIHGDLAEPVATAELVFQKAREALGSVQILVNSAAIFEPGSLLETDEDNWDRHQAINVKAPFFLIQAFARQLLQGQSGNVINIVDWRAESPVPGHAAYTAAKAGLVALTKLLAQELGPQVRVNGIAPGAILPPPGQAAEVFERRGRLNALKRVGSPDEIVRAVQYLLTADFVTGEILHVTGGEELLVGGADRNDS
ncbi:SDR family oxidoreductase [Planctomicrobium piriforme]|uniref:NAD(P)-dependent dehydrogenase, short-chain alcohol dehydrogenase family n=1 Tax=Planctomicrobium piriforme TaxID=1576369 RepID=A0A1I3QBI2_9PLAN|nr:SDR family oxidoreductase [Planctomicrobium piriforme]SFJ31644.1 NAD(P)-dependent dehydrogenase, short-chain alcohol dehydrogenase family [Planctomicrobium piriforme]